MGTVCSNHGGWFSSRARFDPLDDTKLWPEDKFPWLPVGRMVLNKNPENFHKEVEQAAFGTGVLVDGIDFSDDKMLQGSTFSYSDTQRYRIGSNYLQLPVNAPKAPVRTNQRRGQMDLRNQRNPGNILILTTSHPCSAVLKKLIKKVVHHTNQCIMVR